MIEIESNLSKEDINRISVLGLAHLGDCVFELLVRSYLCSQHNTDVNVLHRKTVSMVNANAQAVYADFILPVLSEDELAVFRRGRNAKVNSVPKNSSVMEYHKATALEALFGWLYLNGKNDRIKELFSILLNNMYKNGD